MARNGANIVNVAKNDVADEKWGLRGTVMRIIEMTKIWQMPCRKMRREPLKCHSHKKMMVLTI